MVVRANVVYAVANGTLYRSDDGGATFAARSSGLGQTAVDPANANIVYEFATVRARRSIDGGATWTSIANGLPGFLVPAKIVISPNHPETIYLANSCGSRLANAGGLFRSADRGGSWSSTDNGKCVTDVAIDPATDAVYPLLRDPFFVAFQPTPLPAHQVLGSHGIGYDTRDNYVIDKLVVLRNFSGTWQKLAGLEPNVNELALDAATGRLFAATSNGLFLNPTGGPYWIPLLTAPATNVAVGGGLLYVNTSRGLLRAPPAPLAPLPALAPRPGAPAPARGLAADPNTGVLYAASDGVWSSGDAGASWQTSDAVPFDDVDELFIANGAFYAIKSGALLKSIDGKAWTQILAGVRAFAFDSNVLYAGTARGLLVSLDGGASWTLADPAETTAIAA